MLANETLAGQYVDCKGVTQSITVGQCRAIFEQFEDKTNWKNPIKGVCLAEDFNAIKFAIEFFHGGRVKIQKATSGVETCLIHFFNNGYEG